MMLDISSLIKAREQLRESVAYYHSDLAKSDARLALQLRAASIQAFEYTYELSIKLLQRALREFETDALLKQTPYKEMMRIAAQRGLIADPLVWFEYRTLRNMTSHTYDETKAQDVFAALEGFASSVDELITKLQT